MSEAFLRRFHAEHAGITSRVLARGGSYQRLAERVAGARRVLDLGCGDAPLPDAIGIDLSLDELRLARGPRVQGRAHELPFAAGAFDAVVSHLAFVLLDQPEGVVAELDRVLAPGGSFHAVLGGGPTGDGDDLFHRFLALAQPRGPRLGDPRTSHEAGWRALFAGWRIAFERFEVDLSGSFDEVWAFLASGYQTFDTSVRDRLATPEPCECRVVMWLASATR